MCKAIREMREVSKVEGEREMAKKMLLDGLTPEFIAKYSNLTIEEIQTLAPVSKTVSE